MKSLVLILGLILSSALQSAACDCFEILTHRKEFRQSKAVFIGEVIKIETPPLEDREDLSDDVKKQLGDLITFKVIQSWKGAKSELKVWTHATHDICSKWQFEVGKKYLVYVRKTKGVSIGAEFCSRTRPLETTNQELLNDFRQLGTF